MRPDVQSTLQPIILAKWPPVADLDDHAVNLLIERSSLGTTGARLLRHRTTLSEAEPLSRHADTTEHQPDIASIKTPRPATVQADIVRVLAREGRLAQTAATASPELRAVLNGATFAIAEPLVF